MGLWIDSAILEESVEWNIETIVDALNDYSGKGSICSFPAEGILQLLLDGSGDFWGMVDYEKGTCDFDTELFGKILNVAKRYGSESYRNSPAVIGERWVHQLGSFESREELQAQGKTAFGYIFDDGVYSLLFCETSLAVNSNSENKDGCCEFIAFLLQEESQKKLIGSAMAGLPSNRKVFAQQQAYELEWSGKREDITLRYGILHGSCTEEDAAEQLEVIIENINNRVQLYLNER